MTRVEQAQEWLQEIHDNTLNPNIILTSEYDLTQIYRAKEIINHFLNKQISHF